MSSETFQERIDMKECIKECVGYESDFTLNLYPQGLFLGRGQVRNYEWSQRKLLGGKYIWALRLSKEQHTMTFYD